MWFLFVMVLLATTPATDAFVPGWTSAVDRQPLAFSSVTSGPVSIDEKNLFSPTALFAKSKGKANAKLAALEALEALEESDGGLDQPLSKKELKELQKKQKKADKAAVAESSNDDVSNKSGNKKNAKAAALAALDALEDEEMEKPVSLKEQKALLKKQKQKEDGGQDMVPEQPKLSKKEEKLRKMMELEQMDASQEQAKPEDDEPKLSKKELKALKKKEEKMAEKAAAKAEKKAQRASELEEMQENGSEDDKATTPAPVQTSKPTLEDKIRKERPPPRIRVMESAQPGYVSLRLEKVGITFRNQEVLKDVTWGVQSGDRIG